MEIFDKLECLNRWKLQFSEEVQMFSAIGMDLIDSCYSFDWGRFFVGEIINIKEIRHIDRLIVGTKS